MWTHYNKRNIIKIRKNITFFECVYVNKKFSYSLLYFFVTKYCAMRNISISTVLFLSSELS